MILPVNQGAVGAGLSESGDVLLLPTREASRPEQSVISSLNGMARLLNIANKLDNGGLCVGRELTCISGAYFNPKWKTRNGGSESYFGLELADLIAYPVYVLP